MPVADVLTALKDHRKRAAGYDLARDYEEGRHRHPYATPAFARKYAWILQQARMNICPTVRSNFTDLVQIQAWTGASETAASQYAETTDLDQVIDLAVNESWRCGDAYILVWPGADGQRRPWYHRADQVAFALDPADPTVMAWAAKLWVTDDGYGRVNVYYPKQLERWATVGKVRETGESAIAWDTKTAETAWAPYTGDGEPEVQTHDMGRVPWIHLPFDPQSQGGHGRSILRDVIPEQDALNHTVHSLLVNTEQYAAPLRALMEHEPTVTIDPATGRAVTERLVVDETREKILGFKGKGPLVQLDPPNSANLLQVKQAYLADAAVLVGIPVSDVVPDLGNVPSGAALRVLAARRTNTVRAYTKAITGRISVLMDLLGVPDARPEWVDPAPMDDTERVTNAQARVDLGYPLEEVLPDLGESPDDIARILEGVAREEATLAAAGRAAVAAIGERPQVMGHADQ